MIEGHKDHEPYTLPTDQPREGHADAILSGRLSEMPEVPRRRNFGEVTISKPDPAAWALAMELAGDDPTLIERQKDGSLIVRNHPNQFRR